MSATKSRKNSGVINKQFVSGGVMATTTNKPLIVPPQQQQQREQEQVQQKPQQHQQQPQGFLQHQQQQQQQRPPLQQQQQQGSAVIPEQNPIPVISTVGSTIIHQNTMVSMKTESDNIVLSDIDMEATRKSIFRKYMTSRKKPSVRAKERRLRQNKRLGKVLIPKNALMALHELRGIKIGDFNIASKTGGGFVCHVTVNNIQYEGFGISKSSAKSNTCEKALRDLFLSKMLQKKSLSKNSSLEKLDTTDSSQHISATNAESDAKNVSPNNIEDIEMKSAENSDDDDLPMVNLASYALYKLFSEWESDGFEIPEFRSTAFATSIHGNNLQNCEISKAESKKASTVRTELPTDWEIMHPAMLLCMMRPGSTYIDLGTEGLAPNQIQKVGITIDGEHFIGTGRSKKSARKDAAINACNKIFGSNFVKDSQ